MTDMVREDALTIAREAIAAVLPEAAVREALKRAPFMTGAGRVVLVAIGKAAWRMAKAAAEILGERCDRGVVITKYHHNMGPIGDFEIHEAGHPIPDDNTVRATERALAAVEGLKKEDTVLFLVSGGGSALFERPREGLNLSDIVSVTDQLLACGADIVEINMIRKRLSAVKAGRFAVLASPASVYAIVLSDVLGDRLDSIASGPAHPDASTAEDALRVVAKYGLDLPEQVRRALDEETPKTVDNVTSVIAGSVGALCHAALAAAERLGYRTLLLTTTLNCEAREAGSFIASMAREIRSSGNPVAPPCAVLLGGETVVHLKGKGRGGRNQEIALAAAKGIAGLPRTAVLSVGSDGTDGPTDAAGGIVDGETARLLAGAGVDLEKSLADNDSYHARAAGSS